MFTKEPKLVALIEDEDWCQAVARLSSHPREARHRSAKSGHSVLFQAIRNEAPLEVIKSLVDAYPEALDDVLDAQSDARTRMPKKNVGWTVVHDVALFSPHPNVLEFLLKQNPSFALVVDEYGRTPLCLLSKCTFRESAEERKIVFEKECLLVNAMASKGNSVVLSNGQSFRLLHNLVTSSKYREDVDLIQYICDKFPEMLRQVDDHGNTVLHTACSCDTRNSGNDFKAAIDVLVSVYPEAAKAKNSDNDYALHLAIKCGKFDAVSLIEAYPPAVLDLDHETGLYPFMYVAAARSTTSGTTEQLTCVYTLLQTCPELNRFALVPY